MRHRPHLLLFLAAACLLPLCSCGKKGPPLPPFRPVFPKIESVSFLQRGSDLRLVWTVRPANGEKVAHPTAFVIYRAQLTEDLREPDVEAPLLEKRMKAVHEDGLEAFARGGAYAWTDTGAAGSEGSVYAVAVKTDWKGREVWSPLYRYRPATPHAPPERPALEVRAEGIHLELSESEPSGPWRVYRGTEEDPVPLASLATVPSGSEHLDKSVALETGYSYRVAWLLSGEATPGIDKLGNPEERKLRAPWEPASFEVESALSAPVSATYVDLYPPPVPENLRAFPEADVVTLLWNPVEAPDLAGYFVYRRSQGGSPVRISTAPEKDTVFRDTDVRPGQTWVYTVTSVDRQDPPNESSPSEPAEALMPKRSSQP